MEAAKRPEPVGPFKFIRVSGRMRFTSVPDREGQSLTRRELELRIRVDFVANWPPGFVTHERMGLQYDTEKGVIVGNFRFVYADQDVNGSPRLFTITREEREDHLRDLMQHWDPSPPLPRFFVVDNVEILRVERNPRFTKSQEEAINGFLLKRVLAKPKAIPE